MITDKDIIKLKETFVTKDELAKAIKPLATKKDLESFAKKKDLDALRYDVGDIKIEIAEIKETLLDMNEHLNTKMDRFLGNIDNVQTESNVCTVVQRRHTEQIEGLAAHIGFILPA
ncbi:MAG: hypothetical protein JWL88_470 [Parcubacteria group bacterium]|nr:hypothetical protein [Parcubacteria group bacterium]